MALGRHIVWTPTVFAALVSYLVTGERLGSSGVIGSALILAGMIAAETGPTPRD
jgi:drug/metabolite transporter (DMT)-like permease